MRSATIVTTISLLGALLLLFGIVLLIEPNRVEAQEEAKEYYGVSECRSCHGSLGRSHRKTPHGLTFMEISEDEADQALIVADFSSGDELRTVQFPDESTPRPFTTQDIAYTLGSGRYLQAYVDKAGDGSYRVLPAQWNVIENAWQALPLADAWPDAAYDFVDNCAYCHVTGLDLEAAKWQDDGVQCEACHGPGSVHVELMDEIDFETPEEREALNASINIAVDSQVCGQCHSRGTAPDGSHPYPLGYLPGADLESTFSLVSPDNTDFWYASDHASMPTMQYNEWLQSGHAQAYNDAASSEYFALECLICHGESYRRAVNLRQNSDQDPDILPIPDVEAERLPVGVTCASCHYPHLEQPEEGEPPLDTARINYELCTSCHHSSSNVSVRHHPVQEIFEGQPVIAEIEAVAGIHFTEAEGPQCNTCHVPQVPVENATRFSHSLKPILPEFAIDSPLQDSCTQCHDNVDSQSMQKLVDSVQENIRTRYETARAALNDAVPGWAKQTLDVIDGDGSWGIHNFAYTNQMLIAVEQELGLVPETAPLALPQVPTYEATFEQQVTEFLTPGEVIFGLTWPSLLLMTLVFGIIGFAAWAFFLKGEDES
jgi:hypothetical protein